MNGSGVNGWNVKIQEEDAIMRGLSGADLRLLLVEIELSDRTKMMMIQDGCKRVCFAAYHVH